MKYLILGLVLSIANASSDRKSTVLDNLKDGFDTIYKYGFNLRDYKGFEKYSFDVFVRKGSDNRTFLMHVENVKYDQRDQNHPLSEEDLKAIELPLAVTVTDEFEVDYVLASETDTIKSLKTKESMLSVLVIDVSPLVSDFPELLKGFVFLEMEEKSEDSPLGVCNITTKIGKKDEEYKLEMKSKRKYCTGQVMESTTSNLKLEQVSADSEFRYSYYFNVDTLHLIGSKTKMVLKDEVGSKHWFKIDAKLEISGYKEFEKEINESNLTIKYTEAELENLKESQDNE